MQPSEKQHTVYGETTPRSDESAKDIHERRATQTFLVHAMLAGKQKDSTGIQGISADDYSLYVLYEGQAYYIRMDSDARNIDVSRVTGIGMAASIMVGGADSPEIRTRNHFRKVFADGARDYLAGVFHIGNWQLLPPVLMALTMEMLSDGRIAATKQAQH